MKRSIQIIALLAVVLAGIWLWFEPGFEPAITLLLGLVTLLGLYLARKETEGASHFRRVFSRLFLPIRRLVGRRSPLSSLTFKTLRGSKVHEHTAEARAIWDSFGPTQNIELRHRGPDLDPYVFDRIEGHSVSFFAEDFNRDGRPDLAVTYHCGAHTRGFKLFSLDAGNILRLVPGSDIGSDWPEIRWADRDGDGFKEIYVKQRNWKGQPTAEFIVEKYVWKGERYVSESEPQK
jgi:hypothetical protein